MRKFKKLLAIFLCLPFLVGLYGTGFAQEADQPSSWAVAAVNFVKEHEIANEELLTNFKQPITREEFAYLLSRSYEVLMDMEMPKIRRNLFNDIDKAKYPDEIENVKLLGIFEGDNLGNFNPKAYITRQEICKVLIYFIRACIPEFDLKDVPDYEFADKNEIASWARERVNEIHYLGIMNGIGNNKIGPKLNTTRQEAFKLIHATCQYVEPKINRDKALKSQNERGTLNGNTLHYGLAAEKDGWIYYRNSAKDGHLYKCKLDGSEKTELLDKPVRNIQVAGDYVYFHIIDNKDFYTTTAPYYRIKTDGTVFEPVVDAVVKNGMIEGDWLYAVNEEKGNEIVKFNLNNGTKLTAYTLDGVDDFALGDKFIIAATSDERQLYIIDRETGNAKAIQNFKSYEYETYKDWAIFIPFEGKNTLGLFRMKYNEDKVEKLDEGNLIYMFVVGNYLIYAALDINENYNVTQTYIKKMNLETLELETIYATKDNLSWLNVAGDYIYFVDEYWSKGMGRIKLDGTGREKVD